MATTKGEDQHRHLGIGLGCEQQHQHDDHRHINHDHTDLAVDGLLLSVAKLRGDINVIRRKSGLDGLQTGKAFLIRLIVVKSNGIQCRHIVVVVLGVVVLHPLYPFDPGDLIFQFLGLVLRNIRHHNLGTAVSDELILHDVQGLAGLRILRQIGRQFTLHLHPVAGKSGENQHNDGKQEKQIPFIHNEGGKLGHKAVSHLFLIFRHWFALLPSRRLFFLHATAWCFSHSAKCRRAYLPPVSAPKHIPDR